jgi:hypothetical protein
VSATKIEWHDYIETLRLTVPDDLHPAGMATIHSWFCEMHDAAEHGDAATVAKLARMVSYKVAQEIEWQRQDAQAARYGAPSERRAGR